MSHYVTPFLVLNLGAEMVYVVAQRLQAQNIAPERATLVLEEIISVLISKHLVTDIMKPQETYSHESVREIIEDVAQCSIMRLDPTSMNKLWDLITMVFKWQVTMSQNIIKLTLRHLYEIENYVVNPDTQLQLHKVQNLVDNFNKILEPKEKLALCQQVTAWLKNFNVKVSLLLKMGLQSMDGKFIITDLNPIAEQMLKNLGENIYEVTQNGKILESSGNINPRIESNNNYENANELQLFVDEILGERKLSTGSQNGDVGFLKLSINNDPNKNNESSNESFGDNQTNFDNIKVNLCHSNDDSNLADYMKDISVKDDDENSFRDDLLNIIEGEESN